MSIELRDVKIMVKNFLTQLKYGTLEHNFSMAKKVFYSWRQLRRLEVGSQAPILLWLN